MLSLLFCVLPALAWAMPSQRRSMSSDQQLALNVVMTLEYLESGFYNVACQRFSEANFTSESYPQDAYEQVCNIAQNKTVAIDNIGGILSNDGVNPTAPCLYTFPTGDVSSFLLEAYTISSAALGACVEALSTFENSSTTAPTALTDLCDALVTESSFLRTTGRACQLHDPLEQGLTPSWAYNLAADFIAACPSAPVPLLPLMPFFRWTAPQPGPSLSPPLQPGTFLSFEWQPEQFLTTVSPGTPLYVALVEPGVEGPATFVEVMVSRADPFGNVNGVAVLPAGVGGTVIACLTTFGGGLDMQDLSDFGTLAGPTVVMLS